MNDAFEPVFPRIDRDPATDAGGRSAATSDTSTNGASGAHGAPDTPAGPTGEPAGFRFNLDEALARLTEPHQPIQRFTWSAVTPATELAPPASSVPLLPPGLLVPGPGAPAPAPAEQVAPAPAPPAPAVPAPLVSAPVASAFPELASRVTSLDEPVAGEAADPLPPIQEATPSDGAPTTLLWTNGSASAPAPAPHAFAPSPESAPPAPAAAPAPTIVTGTQAFAAGSAGFTPDMPYAPNAVSVREVPVGDGAPRLPEAPPAAAPPMATMASATMVAPTTRSTAAKGRKKRKRRRLGRVVLVLFLLAGLVGAALMFGSDYLFPEDWDKDVVPTVEALQSQTGLEFADPVGINLVPDAEYGARVAGNVFGSTFGEDWTAAVPRWRALGLVDGEPTAESVNAIVSTWIPAHYDPADGQIYRSATATGPALDAAMADALAAALLDQQDPAAKAADPAVTATPATPATAAAAPSLASIAVADVRTELVAGGITADADRSALAILPVPMVHRLIGIEDLGAPILTSLGITPDRAGAIAGFDGTAGGDLAGLLDVPWTAAPVAQMAEGDTPDGDAVARGSDFWFTVFAAYLPVDTASAAANAIGADLYQPAVRGAQQCVYGTFTPATPEALGVLQISAVAWAAAAPTQAGAQATTLADGATVQISACDPGTAPDAPRLPEAAASLVARQIARLAA